MKKEFITYRHFRRDSGAITACCKVYSDESRMLVGFALCSPEDMFSKKRGRLIAEGRMNARPIEVALDCRGTFTDKQGNEKEKLGIAQSLINHMKNDMTFAVRQPGYIGSSLGKWLPVFLQEL
jgi:hypothetical protein